VINRTQFVRSKLMLCDS